MDKRDVKHYSVPSWADTLSIGAGDPLMPIALVRAAPALLEALERIVNGDRRLTVVNVETAAAAIRMAKGEPQ